MGRRSLWERITRRARPDLARDALTHLFAVRHPLDVDSDEVSALLAQYGVVGPTARDVLADVWGAALQRFLGDDAVSDAEAEYLIQLRRALGLSERETDRIYQDAVRPRFERAAAAALADSHVSVEEQEALRRLGDALRLPESVRRELYARPAGELLERALSDVTADRRLSPEEFARFAALARNIGIEPKLSEATQRTLHRYAVLWRIENGEIPEVSAPIALQKGEVCHFHCAADWYELRTKTVTIDPGQIAVRIRIARGVYYRSPRIPPTRVKQDLLTQIDRGELYITNKRVLFNGTKKNTTIRMSALIGFTPYSDGLELEKSSGRSPVLILHDDAELAAAVLAGALVRSNE